MGLFSQSSSLLDDLLALHHPSAQVLSVFNRYGEDKSYQGIRTRGVFTKYQLLLFVSRVLDLS
jgi:hypothetical protein